MPSTITPGSIIGGKYRVDHILGEGGMGVVVAAWHLRLEQRVAIKFLHPEMQAVPEIVDRFTREARAASRIDGDHVARVMDVDTTDSGAPFMVMEYLEGTDLSYVRRLGRPLALMEAVGLVLQACEAVGQAHAQGIVHRDIKPANLFLAKRRDGRVRLKVLDFGISKMGGTDVGVTRTTAVMGSAEYMSPEQMFSARSVDARADIWALGVVLFELLTARMPFPGESLPHICALVMSTEAPPIRALRADLPASVEAIVARCLAKNREERYASVEELAAALAPHAAADMAPSAIPPSASNWPSSLPSTPFAVAPPASALIRSATIAGTAATLHDTSRARKSSKTIGVSVLLAVGALAFGVFSLRAADSGSPAPLPDSASAAAPDSATAPPIASPPDADIVVVPIASSSASASPATKAPPATSPPPTATHGRSPPPSGKTPTKITPGGID